MEITKDNYNSLLNRLEYLLDKEESGCELSGSEENELNELIGAIDEYERKNFIDW